MYYNICNEENIKSFNLMGKKSILIRVLEPLYRDIGVPYRIVNIDEYIDVLELYISDTILGSGIINENSFNADHIKELNEFILKNDFDEVVVHCSLGVSRSPAIMICIAKILENVELENIVKNKYRFYNEYIVSKFDNIGYISKKIDSYEILGNVIEEKNDYYDDELIDII